MLKGNPSDRKILNGNLDLHKEMENNRNSKYVGEHKRLCLYFKSLKELKIKEQK